MRWPVESGSGAASGARRYAHKRPLSPDKQAIVIMVWSRLSGIGSPHMPRQIYSTSLLILMCIAFCDIVMYLHLYLHSHTVREIDLVLTTALRDVEPVKLTWLSHSMSKSEPLSYSPTIQWS